jgi:hypothetical protein
MLSILFYTQSGGTFYKRNEKFLCGHGSLGGMRGVSSLVHDNRVRSLQCLPPHYIRITVRATLIAYVEHQKYEIHMFTHIIWNSYFYTWSAAP